MVVEGSLDVSIQCEFIQGSKAMGCLVVLTSEEETEKYRLTRNTRANLVVTLKHAPSRYVGVEAFDIESDGSIGSLAVPGEIIHFRPEMPGKLLMVNFHV